MYKHIQNQNEIKNCEDFLVHCHIIEHLKSINKHQVYNFWEIRKKKEMRDKQKKLKLIGFNNIHV